MKKREGHFGVNELYNEMKTSTSCEFEKYHLLELWKEGVFNLLDDIPMDKRLFYLENHIKIFLSDLSAIAIEASNRARLMLLEKNENPHESLVDGVKKFSDEEMKKEFDVLVHVLARDHHHQEYKTFFVKAFNFNDIGLTYSGTLSGVVQKFNYYANKGSFCRHNLIPKLVGKLKTRLKKLNIEYKYQLDKQKIYAEEKEQEGKEDKNQEEK